MDISPSLERPDLVRLYTRHAIMLVITRLGVIHIERRGLGAAVLKIMITVAILEPRVSLMTESENTPLLRIDYGILLTDSIAARPRANSC